MMTGRESALTPATFALILFGVPLSIAGYAVASLWGRHVYIFDTASNGAVGVVVMCMCAATLLAATVYPDEIALHKLASVLGAAAWSGRSIAYAIVGVAEARWSVAPAVVVHIPLLFCQLAWHVAMVQRAAIAGAAHRAEPG